MQALFGPGLKERWDELCSGRVQGSLRVQTEGHREGFGRNELPASVQTAPFVEVTAVRQIPPYLFIRHSASGG